MASLHKGREEDPNHQSPKEKIAKLMRYNVSKAGKYYGEKRKGGERRGKVKKPLGEQRGRGKKTWEKKKKNKEFRTC